ncbi:hypothetical protein B5G20_07720 [Collinsella sp. An7]|uniref:hypothetical protein n=1 Tax=Collinsella sp. An7 TaxID=1965651 RepID=UPI000B5643B5|nr:hypothetical protein [Collinsella sp. An7]OUN46465.1 hypothetical protein B5G20_07720 [Collinsella sp. An7]
MVKKMRKVATALAVGGVAIVAGSLVGYKIATDKELRDYMVRNLQDAFNISKRKVTGMTEDVAMRTARMTRNPKINQDWVENQWEAIGY